MIDNEIPLNEWSRIMRIADRKSLPEALSYAYDCGYGDGLSKGYDEGFSDEMNE